jgi:hypothetical protein
MTARLFISFLFPEQIELWLHQETTDPESPRKNVFAAEKSLFLSTNNSFGDVSRKIPFFLFCHAVELSSIG